MLLEENERFELYPYKVITDDKKSYLFTSSSNRLYKIDEKMHMLLKYEGKSYTEIKKLVSHNISEDEFISYIQNMKSNNLILDKNINITNKIYDFDIHTIVLMVCQECNLKCNYCYGDEGEYNDCGQMDFSTAKKSIDYLLKNCGKRKQVGIIFFGGEPLINYELIKKIVEYINIKEKETGIHISKNMTTNATLLNEDIENYLIENQIDIKVSLDGWKELNDRNRCYKNGKGTYDSIIEKTKKLRENKMASVRATLTPSCLESGKIEKYLYDLGFEMVDMSYAENELSEEDYMRIYKEESFNYIDLIKCLKDKKYSEIDKYYSKQKLYLSFIHRSGQAYFACGSGRGMYAVDIKGNIYPCHRFVGDQEFYLGNLDDGIHRRESFLRKTMVENKDQCSKCWIKNFCLGQCPHTNLTLTGKVEESYPISCTMNRAMFEDGIKAYVSLSSEDKRMLFGEG